MMKLFYLQLIKSSPNEHFEDILENLSLGAEGV
jgi:hypothetical protein